MTEFWERIEPSPLDEFSRKGEVKNIAQHRGLGKFLPWLFNRSISIKVEGKGDDNLSINKNSLARYICQAYVYGDEPSLKESQKTIRRIIDEVRGEANPPQTLGQLIKAVVKKFSEDKRNEAVKTVLEAKEAPKKFQIKTAADYQRFDDVFKRCRSVHEAGKGIETAGTESSPLLKLKDETITHVSKSLLEPAKAEISKVCVDLQAIEGLPEDIKTKAEQKDPNFDTYNIIVKLVNDQAKLAIPQDLTAKEDVIKAAKFLAFRQQTSQVLQNYKDEIAKIPVGEGWGEEVQVARQSAEDKRQALDDLLTGAQNAKLEEYETTETTIKAAQQGCSEAIAACKRLTAAKLASLVTENEEALAALEGQIATAKTSKLTTKDAEQYLAQGKADLAAANENLNLQERLQNLQKNTQFIKNASAELERAINQKELIHALGAAIDQLGLSTGKQKVLSDQLAAAVKSNSLAAFEGKLKSLSEKKLILDDLKAELGKLGSKKEVSEGVKAAYSTVEQSITSLASIFEEAAVLDGADFKDKIPKFDAQTEKCQKDLIALRKHIDLHDSKEIIRIMTDLQYKDALSGVLSKQYTASGGKTAVDLKHDALVAYLKKNLGVVHDSKNLVLDEARAALWDSTQKIMKGLFLPIPSESKLEDKLNGSIQLLKEWHTKTKTQLSDEGLTRCPVFLKRFTDLKKDNLTDLAGPLTNQDKMKAVDEFAKRTQAWKKISKDSDEKLKEHDLLRAEAELLGPQGKAFLEKLEKAQRGFSQYLSDIDEKQSPDLALIERQGVDCVNILTECHTTIRPAMNKAMEDECGRLEKDIDDQRTKLATILNTQQPPISIKADASLGEKLKKLKEIKSEFDKKLAQARLAQQPEEVQKLVKGIDANCKNISEAINGFLESWNDAVEKQMPEDQFEVLQTTSKALIEEATRPVVDQFRSHPELMNDHLTKLLEPFDAIKDADQRDVCLEPLEELISGEKSRENTAFHNKVYAQLQKLEQDSNAAYFLVQDPYDRFADDLDLAITDKDPALLSTVLERIVHTVAIDPTRVRDTIHLLANALYKAPVAMQKVADGIKGSALLEEGIRTLAFTFDRGVAPEQGVVSLEVDAQKTVQELADALHLQYKNFQKGEWKGDSAETALVYQTRSPLNEKPQIAEMALDLGLQRFSEEAKRTDVHLIFVGPELAFQAAGYSAFVGRLDELSEISRRHPGVTFVPGSIVVSDEDKKNVYIALPVFENGHLVSLNFKTEKDDLNETLEMSIPWGADDEARLKAISDFSANTCILGNGQAFAIEMGGDHTKGVLRKESEARGGEKGPDIQVVVDRGQAIDRGNVVVRNGGMFGLLDETEDVKTSAGLIGKGKELPLENSETNPNSDWLGNLITAHSAVHPITPEYSNIADLVPRPVDATAANLLHEMGVETKPSDLVRYLTQNIVRYCPISDQKGKEQLNTPEDLKSAFTTTLRRYTFASKDEMYEFNKLLENGGDITKFRSAFFQCLADFLKKPIVMYTDLASADREVFMPDRSKVREIPKDALEIGYSYKTGTMFVPTWQGEEYKKAQEQFDAAIAMFRKRVKDLPPDFASQRNGIDQMLNAIPKFFGPIQFPSVPAQRVIKKNAERIEQLEKRLKSLSDKVGSVVDSGANVIDDWATDQEISYDSFAKTWDEYASSIEGTTPLSPGLEECIEDLDTLKSFKTAPSAGGWGWVGYKRRLWMEGDTLVAQDAWKDDTSGVGAKLEHIFTTLSPFLSKISKDARTELQEVMKFIGMQYSGDNDIQAAVGLFSEALRVEGA